MEISYYIDNPNVTIPFPFFLSVGSIRRIDSMMVVEGCDVLAAMMGSRREHVKFFYSVY